MRMNYGYHKMPKQNKCSWKLTKEELEAAIEAFERKRLAKNDGEIHRGSYILMWKPEAPDHLKN